MTTNHAVLQHQKVSTIELFFDLVFVFLITQLTHMVEHAHGWVDFLTAGVALVLLWWLYAAYVWLVSALGKEQRVRLVLLLAMAGFLLAAVALPRMATREASVFAWAYLALVLLHSVTFWYLVHSGHRRAGNGRSGRWIAMERSRCLVPGSGASHASRNVSRPGIRGRRRSGRMRGVLLRTQ